VTSTLEKGGESGDREHYSTKVFALRRRRTTLPDFVETEEFVLSKHMFEGGTSIDEAPAQTRKRVSSQDDHRLQGKRGKTPLLVEIAEESVL